MWRTSGRHWRVANLLLMLMVLSLHARRLLLRRLHVGMRVLHRVRRGLRGRWGLVVTRAAHAHACTIAQNLLLLTLTVIGNLVGGLRRLLHVAAAMHSHWEGGLLWVALTLVLGRTVCGLHMRVAILLSKHLLLITWLLGSACFPAHTPAPSFLALRVVSGRSRPRA